MTVVRARLAVTLVFVLLVLTACEDEPAPTLRTAAAAPPPTAVGASLTDPVVFCAAAVDIDAPDARYGGPVTPDAIEKGMRQAGAPTNGLRWRCMGGKVYACGVGANLPCGRANLSPQPGPGIVSWCSEHPDAQVVPAVATGRETVFSWACQGGVPIIARQPFTADARGFLAQFWHEIRPPG